MLALAIIMIALSFGATTASAQVFTCGGPYRIDMTALPNAPQCYYPLQVSTSWGGGAVTWPMPGFPGYPGPGMFLEMPPTPLGMQLDFVNVGGTIIPAATVPAQRSVLTSCGLLCAVICTDPAGCLVIKVYPGPCPPMILPCP